MKLLFSLVFVCVINFASAGTFYLSAVSGDDSRTESEAQNAATPWKSLNKLNAFFSNLKPGDSVLLKRGERFYGYINVKQSGSAISPIIIGAYGTGNKPVITSLITLTGWVSKGNGIWESAADSSFGSVVNMVLLNGVEQEMGRYPNSNADNKGYLNFESHVGTTSITDTDLNTSINWKGAELVLRPRHWVLDRSLITAQSGNTISYATNSPYEPYENYGYFIQNSLKTLDKVGEWYYNPATKKMSVFFGLYGPLFSVVKAATGIGEVISAVKRSNVVFDNLVIEGANNSGFNILDGSDISIQNCDILFSGVNGIFAAGHANLTVQNCTIANSSNNAIDLPYGVTNALIKSNQITNTAVNAGMLQNGEGTGVAIYTNGDGNRIENNEIRSTGFIGITFYGNNVTIKNNRIDSFCFVKDDGGGIYTHGGLTANTNRQIIGNIITGGIGAGAGTDHFDKRSVTGIYMDANTTDVEIKDNTVTTCNQGIMIQSTTRITIKNNTVFDNTKQMVMIHDKDNNPVSETVMTGNIFFSKEKEQWALYVLSSADDISQFGRFDSNYYARPIDDNITIFTSYTGPNGAVIQNYDLNGWRTAYAQDAHSKKTAKEIMPYQIDSLIGINKFIKGGDFATDIKGISGTACNLLWSNAGILDGGYLQVMPTSRGSSVYFKVGEVSAGKNYLLSYSEKGSATEDVTIGSSLKQSGSPFTSLTQVQNSQLTRLRNENEVLFSPSATEASAIVFFKVDNQSEYYLDNIKFFEAAAKNTNPDDSITFEYNATTLARQVNLTGNYIDTRGRLYSGSVILQPYTSIILIKTSEAAENTAPTITITSNINSAVIDPLSTVSVNAAAVDADGLISKVEFYSGSTLIKTEYKAPYDCILDSLSPGNYSITAKATDDGGLTTTSAPLLFTVSPVNLPLTANTATTELDGGTTEGSSTKKSAAISKVLPGEKEIAFSNSEIEKSNLNNNLSRSEKNAKGLSQPDVLKITRFRLFPNPTVNTIQIYFEGLQDNLNVKLAIYNTAGAVVKTYPVSLSRNNIKVDVSSLVPGLYTVGFSGNNFNINKQFLKIK